MLVDHRYQRVWKNLALYRGQIFTSSSGQELNLDSQPKYRHYVDGALLIDRSTGIIEAVKDFSKVFSNGAKLKQAQEKGLSYFDCRPDWLLPGFIDTHVHLPQILMAGRSGLPLLQWLQRYTFPAEKSLADPKVARQVARHFFASLARVGTTTAVVFATLHQEATHIAFEEAKRAGLRVFMGQVLMDQHGARGYVQRDWRRAIRESEELIRIWKKEPSGLLHYLVTPRFAASCSRRLLEACGQLAADHKLGLQTHLNEEEAEIRFVRKVHPWAKNYTDVYRQTGVIPEDRLSVLAHQVHVDRRELQLLNHRQVCIAHCPSSNFALRSGTDAGGQFDFWKVYEGGKRRVGLGSDVGGGRGLSLFETMRYGSDIKANRLSLFQLWHLATSGGAEALGQNTGALEPGREADFIVVDPEILNPSRTQEGRVLYPLRDLQDHLLVMMSYGSSLVPGFVKQTFVRGRKVFQAS